MLLFFTGCVWVCIHIGSAWEASCAQEQWQRPHWWASVHLSLHLREYEDLRTESLSLCLQRRPVGGGPSLPAMRYQAARPNHLPERVLLLREDLEVLLGQLHRGQRLQPEVGPGVQEARQVLEGVQAQAVIPIVGQVCHEDADLLQGGKMGGRGCRSLLHYLHPHFWPTGLA